MESEGKLWSNNCWRKLDGVVGFSRGLSSDQCWFAMSSRILDLNEGSERGREGCVGVGQVWQSWTD